MTRHQRQHHRQFNKIYLITIRISIKTKIHLIKINLTIKTNIKTKIHTIKIKTVLTHINKTNRTEFIYSRNLPILSQLSDTQRKPLTRAPIVHMGMIFIVRDVIHQMTGQDKRDSVLGKRRLAD